MNRVFVTISLLVFYGASCFGILISGISLFKPEHANAENKPEQTFREPELVQYLRNNSATVRIWFSVQGHGSGIVVSKEGHIVTANHVVVEQDKVLERIIVEASGPDGHTRHCQAKVLMTDERNDLALLKTDCQLSEPAVLEDERNIHPGNSFYNIGYPYDIAKFVDSGKIGNIGIDIASTSDMMLTKTSVMPGTSGSAGFSDYNGKMIGIVTNFFMYDKSYILGGIRQIKYVRQLLEKARVPYFTEFDGKPKSYPPLPKSPSPTGK